MNEGYIKLFRKSLNSPVMKSANLWYLWSWLLLKASHKDYKTIIGHQEIELKRGQLIFGLKKAVEETCLSYQTIRSNLHSLVKLKNLTIKTTNKFSIITICNWDTYQSQENENNTLTNKQITNKQQTNNNKQEVKEVKECKEEKITDIVSQVMDYLNNVTNSKFRNAQDLPARLKEGYTLDDCKLVIDKKSKDPFFIEHPDFMKPETLFCKKHFDGYLNAPAKGNGNGSHPDAPRPGYVKRSEIQTKIEIDKYE